MAYTRRYGLGNGSGSIMMTTTSTPLFHRLLAISQQPGTDAQKREAAKQAILQQPEAGRIAVPAGAQQVLTAGPAQAGMASTILDTLTNPIVLVGVGLLAMTMIFKR